MALRYIASGGVEWPARSKLYWSFVIQRAALDLPLNVPHNLKSGSLVLVVADIVSGVAV